MQLRRSKILTVGLLLAFAACAHRAGAASDEATTPASAEVRVNVTNHAGLSMEIFATGSGINHRLGLVTPGIARTFILPPSLVGNGPVEFLAQASGGSGTVVRSGQLNFSPGNVIDFEIATNLVGSRATVQRR